MKILVTEDLIDNIENLKSFNLQIEKISINEINFLNINLFNSNVYKLVFDEFLTFSKFQKLNFNSEDKIIFQVKKSNLSKFSNFQGNVEILYYENKKEEIFPWDITSIIYSKNKTFSIYLLEYFTKNDNNFRNFTGYFIKELVRLKLLKENDINVVSTLLKEKKDFKYQDALIKVEKLDLKNIDLAILSTQKIEKLLYVSGFNIENAKRYIISLKKLLQF